MTQGLPANTTEPTLDSLLRIARDRSARGNGSRHDWQRVAERDPNLAYQELRDFLRRTHNAEFTGVNPYERRSRAPGALFGFLVGCAVMVALWIFLPYARSHWMDFGVWRDVATAGQFLSTLFVPIGALAGAWWGQRRSGVRRDTTPGFSHDASFEELLDAFERTQHIGRARVY